MRWHRPTGDPLVKGVPLHAEMIGDLGDRKPSVSDQLDIASEIDRGNTIPACDCGPHSHDELCREDDDLSILIRASVILCGRIGQTPRIQ